jgi:hypothetical protein
VRLTFVVSTLCLLLGLSTALAQTGETARVTAATAVIRAEPKATAVVLTTVKAGATLEVRAIEGDWVKIAMFMAGVRFEAYVSKRSVVIEKNDKPATAAPASTPAARGAAPAARDAVVSKFGMSAVVESGAKTSGLVPTMTRVMPMAARADTAKAAATAMPIGQGSPLPTTPSAVVTYVWLIDRVAADVRVMTESRPTIVVRYDAAPGISPDDFVPAIVRLVGTPTGPRVVSAMRGRVDSPSRTVADWEVGKDLKQEIVRSTTEVTARGLVKLTPEADLEPGEYAIVMRPTGNKNFAGSNVLSPTEDGRVFGIAWVFVRK